MGKVITFSQWMKSPKKEWINNKKEKTLFQIQFRKKSRKKDKKAKIKCQATKTSKGKREGDK
jgi:hypothetical protein